MNESSSRLLACHCHRRHFSLCLRSGAMNESSSGLSACRCHRWLTRLWAYWQSWPRSQEGCFASVSRSSLWTRSQPELSQCRGLKAIAFFLQTTITTRDGLNKSTVPKHDLPLETKVYFLFLSAFNAAFQHVIGQHGQTRNEAITNVEVPAQFHAIIIWF